MRSDTPHPSLLASGDSLTPSRILEDDDVIRVRRVLEYYGSRTWVENTLKSSAVQADRSFNCGGGRISQVALLEFTVRDEDRPCHENSRRGGRGGKRVKGQRAETRS
jgi:hypothetical protein